MNKIIKNSVVFFIFCFLFLSSFIKWSFGQIPTVNPSPAISTQLDQLLQSSNCGELNQQCCDLSKVNIPSISPELPPPFNILNTPIKVISDFISNNLIGPLINTIKDHIYQKLETNIHAYCKDGTQPSDLNNPANCLCISDALANSSRLCLGISTVNEKNQCLNCVTDQKGIWTAIGCVQSDLGIFISQKLLGWGIGLAGVISLLCIIYAAFMMQTSQGNPEKLKKAQELLTSCIMGLMLIIFSVFILRLIGVNILRIPGFT